MLGFAEPVLAGLAIDVADADVDLGAQLAGAAFGVGKEVDAVSVGFTLVAFRNPCPALPRLQILKCLRNPLAFRLYSWPRR